MRWDQLSVGEEPLALPGIPGLVRTVSTPEFAGLRFHEVEARSALNRVPASSRMPFTWTVNPYRGCSHACVYCLAGDTRVLMADGTQRPLGELRVGDAVVGTQERRGGGGRRYVTTHVLAHWRTVKHAYRVRLRDGTSLTASGDHRFLTRRGWRYVTSGADPASGEPRPSLAGTDRLLGPGRAVEAGYRVRAGNAKAPIGGLVSGGPALELAAVEDFGVAMPMFDITTGTGDFVANGVVSHNCFARGTHRYLDLDTGSGFDSEIVVKVNVAERLRAELARPSWGREHVALGTNTDPYQRAEGRYRLMPGIVDALAGSGTPLSILTKGTLLRRDLPRLAAAAERVPVGLGVSIAIWDDELHRSLEPGAPGPRGRLELVKAVREAGLPCGVFLAPVLPWLTDGMDQLDDALGRIAAAGATGVTVVTLHLRPGAREWFFEWLGRERPELVPRYREVYGRGSTASAEYRRWLSARVRPLVRLHGLQGGADRGDGWPRGSMPPGAPPAPAPTAEQLSLL